MIQNVGKPESAQTSSSLVTAPRNQHPTATEFSTAPPNVKSRAGVGPERALRRPRRKNWVRALLLETVSCPQSKPLGFPSQSRLIERAQQGDITARNIVWLNHLRLAMRVIEEIGIPKTLIPDAFQEAVIGLERAIMKFDVQRSHAFSTYAWIWMKQRIKRFLARQWNLIRIPDHRYASFSRFSLQRKACRTPSEWFDHFAAWSGNAYELYVSFVRIDALTYEPVTALDLDRIPARASPQGLDDDETQVIHDAINTLSERDRSIVWRRFGLGGIGVETLDSIGQDLELTRERVRQIEETAIERLRIVLARLLAETCTQRENEVHQKKAASL